MSSYDENIKKWSIPQPDQKYKVVIHCSTYNHERFIRDALEGFVSQKTNFPFCAIIIDDASTDNTAAIIKEYALEYPDIIIPILLQENHMQRGLTRDSYFEKWHKCADYIAQCEGDDYWIDPNKLQRQVDFLEANPEYVMCFHNAFIYVEDFSEAMIFNPEYKKDQDLPIEDAINKWLVPTASMLYRMQYRENPEWMVKIYSGDYSKILYLSTEGKIRYLHSVMSVYRKTYNTNSITTWLRTQSPTFHFEQHIKLLNSFDVGTKGKYHKELALRINFLNKQIKITKARYSKNILLMCAYPLTIGKKVLKRICKKVLKIIDET